MTDGWDRVAGDSVDPDVVNTVRKYIPFVNHGGDLGGYQLKAYSPPWNHPVAGTFPHHDYINTFAQDADGNYFLTRDSVVAAIQEARLNGADSVGIVISDNAPANIAKWVQMIEAATNSPTIDAIVLSSNSDVVTSVQTGVLSPVLTTLQATYPPNTAAIVPVTGSTATSMTCSCTSSVTVGGAITVSGAISGVSVAVTVTISDGVNAQSVSTSGSYSVTFTESVAGTYYFTASFAGTTTYAPSDATSGPCTVGSAPVVTCPQSTPNGTSTHPACCYDGSSIHIFCEGNAAGLFHSVYGSGSWQNLGGTITSEPGAWSRGGGIYCCAVRGQLVSGSYPVYVYDSSLGWINLGANATSAPCGASNGSAQDVYVLGTSGVIYHIHASGTSWGSWESLGGAGHSDPCATDTTAPSYQVYVVGANGSVYENTYSGSGPWGGWRSLGTSTLMGGTAPTSCTDGSNFHLFYTVNNTLVHKVFSGSTWSGEEKINCNGILALTSGPTACMVGSTCHVFARGNNGACWHISGTTGSWASTWDNCGGSIL